jgi:hypothetical protein
LESFNNINNLTLGTSYVIHIVLTTKEKKMFSSTQIELEYIKAKKEYLLIKMARRSSPSKEMINQLKYLNDLIAQLKLRVNAIID